MYGLPTTHTLLVGNSFIVAPEQGVPVVEPQGKRVVSLKGCTTIRNVLIMDFKIVNNKITIQLIITSIKENQELDKMFTRLAL